MINTKSISGVNLIVQKIMIGGVQLMTAGLLLLMLPALIQAQTYDLLLKGGHVIDPKNNIDADRDVAVKDGKIARVAASIPAGDAAKAVDVSGLYVTPGLIDIHTHDFWGIDLHGGYGGAHAIQPDGFSFRSGVTTFVDAGTSGWKTFLEFKDRVIDHVQTRVLAFLNISGLGMQGGSFEQNLNDMNPRTTAMTAERYSDIIVGIKLAHFEGHDWTPIERATQAGRMADIPVMVDFGGATPPLSIEKLFMDVLRPGDIFTHCYSNLRSRESIVDENFNLKPFVLKAQQRGIVFDVGHGGGSLNYHTAVNAINHGLKPNSISSDLHVHSMNAGMKNYTNLLSKFMAMGESLQEVIQQATWNPAREIKHEELGHLSEGAVADITVLKVRDGNFGFVDSDGARLMGDHKLQAELTVRAGRVVWDLNGLSAPDWKKVE